MTPNEIAATAVTLERLLDEVVDVGPLPAVPRPSFFNLLEGLIVVSSLPPGDTEPEVL